MSDEFDTQKARIEAHPTLQAYLASRTLRDWFAGKSLISVIAKCVPQECLNGETMEQMFARKAYLVADAMLAERSKP